MRRAPFVLATLAALAVVPTLAGHTGQSRKTPPGCRS
jgi:hypothetical protein